MVIRHDDELEQCRNLFPGWTAVLGSCDQENTPAVIENKEDSTRPTAKSKTSGRGGARPGAGRKPVGAKLYKEFMQEDLQNHERDNLPKTKKDLKLKQAEHARKARLAKSQAIVVKASVADPVGGAMSKLRVHSEAVNQTAATVSALQSLFCSVVDKVRNSQNPKEETLESLALHSLLTQRHHVMSQSAHSEELQLERPTLKAMMQTTAAALVCGTSLQFRALCNWMLEAQKSGSHRLVLFLKRRRYDETPSKISVNLPGSKEDATAKILQSEMRLAFLLQIQESGKFMWIRAAWPTWLQIMERTTAEVTKSCQLALESAAPDLLRLPYMFDHSFSIVTTDEYKANKKAERSIASEPEQQQYHHCHTGCDVHKGARAISHQVKRVDGHISGMISGALSMGDAGSTRLFREALCQVLEDKLVIHYGLPPSNYVDHTIAVLNLYLPLPGSKCEFVPRSETSSFPVARLKRQRALLLFFLNGNIANDSSVEHYTPMWQLDRGRVLDCMFKFLVGALIPCKPPIFSRKSWTGGDIVLSYFGILSSFHNLLLPVTQVFLKKAAQPTRPLHQRVPEPEQVAPALLESSENPGQHSEQRNNDEVENRVDKIDGHQLPSDHVTAESVSVANIDWAEINRCMKERFWTWVCLRPRTALCIIRLATLPSFRLLHGLLHLGSKSYERRQRIKFLKGQERKFHVQEACSGTLLNSFFDEIWNGLQEASKVLPNACCSWELQVLHFRMLSAGACSIESTLGQVWTSYPVKVFGALEGRADFMTDPQCLLDHLSRGLKQAYSQMLPHEWQILLQTVACDFSLDISQIEARHASTRRVLMSRSLQTKLPNLEDVSAAWVLRNNVVIKQETLHSNSEAKSKSRPKPPKKQPKFRRKMGTWNVFVHKYFSTNLWTAAAMQECSHAYQSLTPEELEQLKRELPEANLRKERGFSSFVRSQHHIAATAECPTEDRSEAHIVEFQGDAQPNLMHQIVQRDLSTLSSTSIMERRGRAIVEKSDSKALAEYKLKQDEVGSYQDLLGVVPDLQTSWHPFPAHIPAADLHWPADKMAEARRVMVHGHRGTSNFGD